MYAICYPFFERGLCGPLSLATKPGLVLQIKKFIVATMMPEMHQIHFKHEEEYLLRGTADLFSGLQSHRTHG